MFNWANGDHISFNFLMESLSTQVGGSRESKGCGKLARVLKYYGLYVAGNVTYL